MRTELKCKTQSDKHFIIINQISFEFQKWIDAIKEHINFYDSFASSKSVEDSTIPVENLMEWMNVS